MATMRDFAARYNITPQTEHVPKSRINEADALLRVLVHENEQGKTCAEYDRPYSLFGQFGNAKVTDVAANLDQKLGQLVAEAIP